ncbi:hypothetical protein SKAU_G00048660 [Synaphobranchus kaupii]|uniref:Uncharacterized protein n=1 Tax=Synaphobranchus kaupii TaxID=118154 RepID=A0A9Q1G3F1_SYNKA|nr:hypothetical protein SKAU_G00048660 [Synaphobranchus kaupii]
MFSGSDQTVPSNNAAAVYHVTKPAARHARAETAARLEPSCRPGRDSAGGLRLAPEAIADLCHLCLDPGPCATPSNPPPNPLPVCQTYAGTSAPVQ